MNKQTQNTNLPGRGPGRPKGSRNKVTNVLKDAILLAGEQAGDGDLVAYLEKQARENPGPFLTLLGKVLPLQVNSEIAVDQLDPLAALLGDIASNGKRLVKTDRD